MTANIELTEGTLELFKAYAKDACNWNYYPMVGGNVSQTLNHNGNLTDLKKHGLVTTFKEDGCTWLRFTDAGVALAAELGITILY